MTEGMMVLAAESLIPGDLVDLEPYLEKWGPPWADDDGRFKYELAEVCDVGRSDVEEGIVYVAFEGQDGWLHVPCGYQFEVDASRHGESKAEAAEEARETTEELMGILRRHRA
jgi:hypothetical protein